jgi:hypothetical protein
MKDYRHRYIRYTVRNKIICVAIVVAAYVAFCFFALYSAKSVKSVKETVEIVSRIEEHNRNAFQTPDGVIVIRP